MDEPTDRAKSILNYHIWGHIEEDDKYFEQTWTKTWQEWKRKKQSGNQIISRYKLLRKKQLTPYFELSKILGSTVKMQLQLRHEPQAIHNNKSKPYSFKTQQQLIIFIWFKSTRKQPRNIHLIDTTFQQNAWTSIHVTTNREIQGLKCPKPNKYTRKEGQPRLNLKQEYNLNLKQYTIQYPISILDSLRNYLSFEEEIAHNINTNEMSAHFDVLRHRKQGNMDSNIQNEYEKRTTK